MPDVQFNDENKDLYQLRSQAMYGQSKVSSFARWLLKHGFIKQESQARGIMLGITVINFVLAGLVFYYFVR